MFKGYAIKIPKPVLKCTVLLRNMVKHQGVLQRKRADGSNRTAGNFF